MHNTDLCQPVKGLAANTMSILSRVYVKPVKGLAANTVRFHAVHCPWWTKVELQKPLWGQSPVSIVVPVSQSCLVPELYLEGGSFTSGHAHLSLSLTCHSITPQTVGPTCTLIVGEEALLLGVLA